MICVYCDLEIHKGDRTYFSRQVGMKGLYHWDCFVAKCRKVNESGINDMNAHLRDNLYCCVDDMAGNYSYDD